MKKVSTFLTILSISSYAFAGSSFGFGFARGVAHPKAPKIEKISVETKFDCQGYSTSAREIANGAELGSLSDAEILENMRGTGILFYMTVGSKKRAVNATLRGSNFSCE